jgi:UTP--glucose-1-phosphate uridylyltransferase
MLPVFAPSENGTCVVKPLLQLVFEQLYDVGIREFCFIIGRGKRVIEDHFTPDFGYLAELEGQRKNHLVADLGAFYRRLEDSDLVWINQHKPLGFGDAVLKARRTIRDEDFLVHAGDTYIVSENNDHLRTVLEIFSTKIPEATLMVKHMLDVRQRGVIDGHELSLGLYLVNGACEKPEYPISNLAIEPVYVFHSSIFEALAGTEPGKNGEIQLTDAIQSLIESGKEVIAWQLYENNLRLDVGDPESYWEALRLSHQYAAERMATNMFQTVLGGRQSKGTEKVREL